MIMVFSFGEYPKEYNPKIHGPYNPGRFYGKQENFADVTIGELRGWLCRKSYHPQALLACVNRAFWRWNLKYLQAKKTTFAPFAQMAVCLSITYYLLQYKSHTYHRHAKYQ